MLLDSTGVLFRLPMADMLSIVASEKKRVGAGQGNFSRDAKPETELFRTKASLHVNALGDKPQKSPARLAGWWPVKSINSWCFEATYSRILINADNRD